MAEGERVPITAVLQEIDKAVRTEQGDDALVEDAATTLAEVRASSSCLLAWPEHHNARALASALTAPGPCSIQLVSE